MLESALRHYTLRQKYQRNGFYGAKTKFLYVIGCKNDPKIVILDFLGHFLLVYTPQTYPNVVYVSRYLQKSCDLWFEYGAPKFQVFELLSIIDGAPDLDYV